MKRKLVAPLLASALLISAFVQTASIRGAQRRPRRDHAARTAASGNRHARFNDLAERYLRAHYEFHPTEATAEGLHQYDLALETRSPEQVAREVRRLRSTLAELSRLPEWRLSGEARQDHLLLQSHARAALLELEETRTHERDAGLYNRLAAASIDHLLKRSYAPIEQRFDALIQRERQIPRLLEEARANLTAPTRLHTETAIQEVRGSVEFFRRVVPQMFERAGGGRLSAERRAEFSTTNEAVVVALARFGEWLERDLLPRASADFALGAETLRRKLLYEEMIERAPADLVREGERELRRTQEEMRALSEEIAPGEGTAAALRSLRREHPSAGGLVGETRAELARVRAFIATQQLLTPPREGVLQVAETPLYARAVHDASLDAPGLAARPTDEAFFYVTPPDRAWDARRREEHLGLYNRYALPLISIHEGYPGHYYQLLVARSAPAAASSRVRSLFRSASFVEGWAHYSEQMMLDEGFGGNNPKLRLAQLHLSLVSLCRYLASLRMHGQGMSYEEATEFFIREGFLSRANAEREARRAAFEPASLAATHGKMEILKLRAAWREELGASFRLADFHDRLLSYGALPFKILRLQMLGQTPRQQWPSRPEATSGEGEEQVEFTLLATGTMSAHEGAGTVELITDAEHWRRAWEVVGMDRPRPEINFNTRAVLVVFQGQKPTGGYSISIDKIRRDGTRLAVYPLERRPASEDVTTQVITSPFVAVTIPRPAVATTVRLEDGRGGIEQKPSIRQRNVTPRRRPKRRRS